MCADYTLQLQNIEMHVIDDDCTITCPNINIYIYVTGGISIYFKNTRICTVHNIKSSHCLLLSRCICGVSFNGDGQ